MKFIYLLLITATFPAQAWEKTTLVTAEDLLNCDYRLVVVKKDGNDTVTIAHRSDAFLKRDNGGESVILLSFPRPSFDVRGSASDGNFLLDVSPGRDVAARLKRLQWNAIETNLEKRCAQNAS